VKAPPGSLPEEEKGTNGGFERCGGYFGGTVRKTAMPPIASRIKGGARSGANFSDRGGWSEKGCLRKRLEKGHSGHRLAAAAEPAPSPAPLKTPRTKLGAKNLP